MEDVGRLTEQRPRELAELAHKIRRAIQESYSIERSGSEATITTASGLSIAIPPDLIGDVQRFLREIDGKKTEPKAGKDYEGEEISEAEVRFRLGDRASWEVDRAKLMKKRDAKPLVFQVSDEDLSHLVTQPSYVTYELIHCVRKTLLAPLHAFKGLKRGTGAPPRLNKGWAFCAKPRQAYHNDGTGFPAPSNMVFVVYADKDRYVFDWDWVKEDPNEPGYPLDRQLRFDDEVALDQEAVLKLVEEVQPGKLDASKACYSPRGDCIFCYVADGEAFAERINSDLTVFRQLETDEVMGFKVKNVRRILQKEKSIILADAPGLTVRVVSMLLATFKLHKDANIQIYSVVIEALHKNVSEPLTVQLPQDIAQSTVS